MPTQDISRHLHQPEKHYAGVRMQQGRVILDSDWNERSSIEAEDLRRTISELACSKGTPNGGMLVSDVAGDPNPYNFHIANGSYYLGGMRLVVDAAAGWETYRTQSDWLQVDATDGSTMTVPVGADRIDLVYVYAWEQPVSAIEDSELFEVALGGRDTSVRMRRMRRFHSMVVSPATNPPTFTSADGFDVLVNELNTGNANFDRPTSELISEGRLRVEASQDPVSTEDPCNIPEVEGYVGAENQAIRVELRGDLKFTWGFDNASPLYRVKVSSETPSTLTFITEPADLPSMPRAGQVVEVLRWGAKLPNTEKVAETQGTLHKVLTTYDPTTRELVLDSDVTVGWIAWLASHSGHYNPDDGDDEQYLYLRVWDRGLNTSAPAEISYVVDTPVSLGDTGLKITVTEDGLAGDYWIIAARPSTPDKFVPWDLEETDGVPPHGPRRFYAPLALIRWTAGVPTVEDARTRMRTLCEGGCCKVTVGNGIESHGLVDTLQEAIDLLADTGGKICVLPGVHEVEVLLDELTGILIEGCGPRSILTNPRPPVPNTTNGVNYGPVLSIVDCTDIVVKDLRIEAYHAFGVMVDRTAESETCTQIRLDHLEVECLGAGGWTFPDQVFVYEQPLAGIAVFGATEVDIVDCEIDMARVNTGSHAVVLRGTHLRMRNCSVRAEAQAEQYIAPANGGINVRSGSRDVEISHCRIEGGSSNGISLGHQIEVERPEELHEVDWLTLNHAFPLDGTTGDITAEESCADHDDPFEDDDPEDPDKVWIPAGPVEDIRIHDNVIRDMGGSGISTAVFFPAAFDWDGDDEHDGVPRFIVAAEIDIARNLIENNARFNYFPANFQNFDRALGGITLAASVNAWIHENTIRNNCAGYQTPKCGIGLIAAMNAVIEDNRIIDNGDRHPGGVAAWVMRGMRGGIVIQEATTVRAKASGQPTFPVTIPLVEMSGTTKDYTNASRESAVIIRGNEVSQPLGKALWIRRGFGPITVTGNSFESFGDPVNGVEIGTTRLCWNNGDNTLAAKARGTAVEILDYAKAIEVDWSVASAVASEKGELAWTDEAGGEVDGGGILFAHNSVRSAWDVTHVQPSAVFICSFDQATVQSNLVWTNLHPNFSLSGGTPLSEFYDDAPDQSEISGFYVAAVYVAATSTAAVNANRVVHETYGALFSIFVGPPAVLAGGFHESIRNSTMLTSNVTTHVSVVASPATIPPLLVVVNNVTIFPDPTPPTYTVSVPANSRDITVLG